jgi:integrase
VDSRILVGREESCDRRVVQVAIKFSHILVDLDGAFAQEGCSIRASRAVARCMTIDPTFPRITIHDLRHTAASLAVSSGANVKAVQRMLGHASAATTLDVYADLFDDDLDAVAEALDRHAAESVVVKM